MCPNKGLFEKYKQIDGDIVLLGNKSCKVIGDWFIKPQNAQWNRKGVGRCETCSEIEEKSDLLRHIGQGGLRLQV